MRSLNSPLALLLLIPAMAGCQFSMSAGGPDYKKLENAISDNLNENYQTFNKQVSGVDCPRQSETPKTGDTFICKADLDGTPVRVLVTVKDDEQNVDFSTMDTVYDLSTVAQRLTQEISADRGFAVMVTCGEGLKVVEIGQSFECTAADRNGDTRQVKVTAGAVDAPDRWEIIDKP
ncbi:MAG: DUF4333 domain-containing protein [Mycobacterium sp.]|nr:DUF4333 domain-containing protein [Mycobacterium sp.]